MRRAAHIFYFIHLYKQKDQLSKSVVNEISQKLEGVYLDAIKAWQE